MSLAFENLSVQVQEGRKKCSPNCCAAEAHRESFFALNNVSGIVQPGEMCLLLGPPSSGRSTMLRAISGRLNRKDVLYGSVMVDGLPVDVRAQKLRRLTAFVSSDDKTHSIVLTVRETFDFAAKCSSRFNNDKERENEVNAMLDLLGLSHVADTVVGGDALRGVSGGQKRRVTVGEMLLNRDSLFYCLDEVTNGLDATTATDLIEKLSTYCKESKKVIIMSLLQPTPLAFSLFSKVLVLTRKGEQAYFGPPQVNQLHKYFLASPTDRELSVDEFIINQCLLPNTEVFKLQARRTPSPTKLKDVEPPESVDEFWAQHFEESQERVDMVLELSNIKRQHRKRDLNFEEMHVAKFTLNAWEQFLVIIERRFLLLGRNVMVPYRVLAAVIFGIIVGSLFGDLGNDMFGTLGRVGYMFLSLFLTLMLAAAVTLPENFRQRVTFFKHRNSEYYSTGVYYIVMVLTDLPLSVLEALILSVIPYFWVGMRSGANHYMYFFGILLALECVGQAFGRMISCAAPTQVLANTLTTVFIFTCGLLAGFMPSYTGIGWWWRWLSWLNPVAYAFEGIMINQFGETEVTVGAGVFSVVGSNALDSSNGGNKVLQTLDLPRVPFTSLRNLLAFDMCMVFLLAIVLDIIGYVILDSSRTWYSNLTRLGRRISSGTPAWVAGAESIFMDENTKRRVAHGATIANIPQENTMLKHDNQYTKSDNALNELALKDVKVNTGGAQIESGTFRLSVDKVCYDVPYHPTKDENKKFKEAEKTGEDKSKSCSSWIGSCMAGKRLGKGKSSANLPEDELESQPTKEGQSKSGTTNCCGKPTPELRLLNNVSASFPAGMTALMGESGAGKTTLLDVIAGYKTGGTITGSIVVNGHATTDMGKLWPQMRGYAEQTDLLNPYLSVEETVLFSCHCRLPANWSSKQKASAGRKQLRAMGLHDFRNIIVGKDEEGIPKHARKRLTIAIELVANPKVLFLDEPTTGLDGPNALTVMSAVRRIVDQDKLVVIATIHQPSRAVFEQFDRLLLLAKGGVVAFNGELGPKCETLLAYFHDALKEFNVPSKNLQFDETNPADFVVEAVGKIGAADCANFFRDSQTNKLVADMVNYDLSNKGNGMPDLDIKPGFCEQLGLLIRRQLYSLWRNSTYSMVRIIWTVFGALLISTVFFQLDNQINSAVLRIGSIFFAVFILTVPLQSVVVPLVEDRAILYRETISGTYSHAAYWLGLLLADLTLHFLSTILFYVIFYYIVNLRPGAEFGGYFFLMLFVASWMLPTLGQLFAFAMPNIESANGVAGLTVILLTVLMGFLLPRPAMPSGWLWANTINVLRYIIQGFCVNEIAGVDYVLNVTDLLTPASVDGASTYSTLGFDNHLLLFKPGTELEEQQRAHDVVSLVYDVLNNKTGPIDNELFNMSHSALTSGATLASNGTETLGLFSCLLENNCFKQDVTTGERDQFLGCIIGDDAVCGKEFAEALNEIVGLEHCLDMPEFLQVMCIVEAIMTFDWETFLKEIYEQIKGLIDIIKIVEDVLTNGLKIPGSLILLVFGWAEFNEETFEIEADSKWYYCFFAVCVFLVAFEIMKLLALRYVQWVVR